MKVMMLVAVALALGIGAAFANEAGPEADTRFTDVAGAIARTPLLSAPSVILLTGAYIAGRRARAGP